jgi:hypothetical protein
MAESRLTPLIVTIGLLFAGGIVTAALLMLAGFLQAPAILVVLLVVGGIGMLGVSLKAALLSRRKPPDSQ